jgi:hypothetical protein
MKTYLSRPELSPERQRAILLGMIASHERMAAMGDRVAAKAIRGWKRELATLPK